MDESKQIEISIVVVVANSHVAAHYGENQKDTISVRNITTSSANAFEVK